MSYQAPTDAADITPGCVLAPIDHRPVKGECVWCGGRLGKGLRRWCSHAHAELFTRNHDWNAAKWEALRRATLEEAVSLGGSEWMKPVGSWCDDCGCRLNATKPNQWGGSRVILDTRAEVNHVEPRAGNGYGKGCWNHQTNLQVLCHRCHVAETMRQHWERKGGRPQAQARITVEMPSLWGSITA